MPRITLLMLTLTGFALAQGYRGLAQYTLDPSQSVRWEKP